MICSRPLPRASPDHDTLARTQPFEGSIYLMAWAEELTEIKAVCGCGRKATMNARLGADGKRVTEGAQICIGHHYRSMARKCFQLRKVTPVKYVPGPTTNHASEGDKENFIKAAVCMKERVTEFPEEKLTKCALDMQDINLAMSSPDVKDDVEETKKAGSCEQMAR